MEPVVMEIVPWLGIRNPFSVFTHLLGAVLGLVALLLLIQRARNAGCAAPRIRGLAVYGLSLVLVFTASTLFHFFDWPAERLVRLKKLDHAAIFLLIASTGGVVYGAARARLASWVVPFVWTVCLTALVLKVVVWPMGLWVTAAVYLVVGWSASVGLFGLVRFAGWRQLRLFIAGLVMASLGAVVFATEKPIIWEGVIEGHEVFHVIVLLAVGLHYAYVYHHCTRPLSVRDEALVEDLLEDEEMDEALADLRLGVE